MSYTLAALRVAAAITAAPPVSLASLELSEETREEVYEELLARGLIFQDARLGGPPDIHPTSEGRARLRAMGRNYPLAYVQHALLETAKELEGSGAIDQKKMDEIVAPLADMTSKAAAGELDQLVKDGLVKGIEIWGGIARPEITSVGRRVLNAGLWPLADDVQGAGQSTHVAQQINAGAGSHIAAAQGAWSSATLNHSEGVPADTFAQILGGLQCLAADVRLGEEDRVLLKDETEMLEETEVGMRDKPGRLKRFLERLASRLVDTAAVEAVESLAALATAAAGQS